MLAPAAMVDRVYHGVGFERDLPVGLAPWLVFGSYFYFRARELTC